MPVDPFSATIAVASTALSFWQGREASKAADRQTEYNNEIALKNYELARREAGARAAQIAAQKKYQAAGSKVEVRRQAEEESGIRLEEHFRKQDRRMESAEAQIQAVVQRGTAAAVQGSSGLRGISKSAVLGEFTKAATRYEGQLQAEERRDTVVTNLSVRDSRARSEQALLAINQPLGGVVSPVAPTLQPRSSSGSTQTFMNILGSVTSGLQLYASLDGTFGRTTVKPATSTPSSSITYV